MVERITKSVYKCVCELRGCPGKKKPWLSDEDRIPERCRWCLRHTWNRPPLRQRLVTVNGKTQRVSAWAKQTGIGKSTIAARLRLGWTPEEAVGTPTRNEN